MADERGTVMLSNQNPQIDATALQDRIRAEIDVMRAAAAERSGRRPKAATARRAPPLFADLARHAVATELIADAARMSKPRTAVPRRLERGPLRVLRPVVRFALRVLNYTQKDQRHVNAATQQALREILRLTVAVAQHVATLTAAQRERDDALVARLAALEARVGAPSDASGVAR
jgi:hypothetical protein